MEERDCEMLREKESKERQRGREPDREQGWQLSRNVKSSQQKKVFLELKKKKKPNENLFSSSSRVERKKGIEKREKEKD